MRSIELNQLAIKLRKQEKSYGEIASTLEVSRQSAKNLINYKLKLLKTKGAPKPKIRGLDSFRIRREISNLKRDGQKVTTTKIIRSCNLKVSVTTCWRNLNSIGYKYKQSKKKISLTNQHKKIRIEIISKWLIDNRNWSETIFSYEKRFSLDGPDSWKSYFTKNEDNSRIVKPYKGRVDIWPLISC